MVKLPIYGLFALGSLTAAQTYDQWKKLCSSGESKIYCEQWMEWMRGGQQGKQPQLPPSSANRPKPFSPKTLTPSTPKSTESPRQPQEWPQWPPTQPIPTPGPTWPETEADKPKMVPPSTAAPQQGIWPPPLFEQAICIVEIYSYTTKAEGQLTRTRTRTIIAPFVSTITQLITTQTTSIQVETIIQEQKERTITSSQTICN